MCISSTPYKQALENILHTQEGNVFVQKFGILQALISHQLEIGVHTKDPMIKVKLLYPINNLVIGKNL